MELGDWFNHTVYVRSSTGRASGASADPTYGPPRTVACRVEAKRQRIRKADGSWVTSSHVVYTDSEIKLSDKVWLPGADVNVSNAGRFPLSIDAPTDKAGGFTLWSVFLG